MTRKQRVNINVIKYNYWVGAWYLTVDSLELELTPPALAWYLTVDSLELELTPPALVSLGSFFIDVLDLVLGRLELLSTGADFLLDFFPLASCKPFSCVTPVDDAARVFNVATGFAADFISGPRFFFLNFRFTGGTWVLSLAPSAIRINRSAAMTTSPTSLTPTDANKPVASATSIPGAPENRQPYITKHNRSIVT